MNSKFDLIILLNDICIFMHIIKMILILKVNTIQNYFYMMPEKRFNHMLPKKSLYLCNEMTKLSKIKCCLKKSIRKCS